MFGAKVENGQFNAFVIYIHEINMPVFHSEDEASESSKSNDSSDEDNDSEVDDDEEDDSKLFKPVFIRKENRITIKDKEQKLLNDQKSNESKLKQLNDRKQQTRELVAETIRRNHEDEQVYTYDVIAWLTREVFFASVCPFERKVV